MMSVLFYVAVAMFGGMLMTRLTRLVKLPNVTAYLIAGVVIGPYCLKLMSAETVSSLNIITEAALGFIAFSIGDQFKLSNLKAIGKPAMVITILESAGAVAVVMISTMLLGFDPIICIMLGALSASTAPAATIMVVRQYKAEGPLTNMLLPVVAADDGTGLIAYSICVNIALNMVNHTAFSVTNTILMPILQILLALVIGAVMGFLLSLCNRFFHSHTNRMSLVIAMVFIGVGVADRFGLSNLLLCMAMGAMYVNLADTKISDRVLGCIDDWTYPLFMLFFVLSGASLSVSTITKVGLIGIVYVLARFGGKFLGSWLGGVITHQPKVIKNNIGWALMPQAGVAIGMATMALQQLPLEYGQQIQTVVLAATLIYEIAGPIATKTALKRAGEIHSEG
jgi:Kef-type K+ transport system membrane component KefB